MDTVFSVLSAVPALVDVCLQTAFSIPSLYAPAVVVWAPNWIVCLPLCLGVLVHTFRHTFRKWSSSPHIVICQCSCFHDRLRLMFTHIYLHTSWQFVNQLFNGDLFKTFCGSSLCFAIHLESRFKSLTAAASSW